MADTLKICGTFEESCNPRQLNEYNKVFSKLLGLGHYQQGKADAFFKDLIAV